MFSFQSCKKLLKKDTYNDQQIKEINENLYQLAEILIENYISNKKNTLLSKRKKERNERNEN